jgi:hypothetical protein
MLTTFFVRPSVLTRLESGPAGPYLLAFANQLQQQRMLLTPFVCICAARMRLGAGFKRKASHSLTWRTIPSAAISYTGVDAPYGHGHRAAHPVPLPPSLFCSHFYAHTESSPSRACCQHSRRPSSGSAALRLIGETCEVSPHSPVRDISSLFVVFSLRLVAPKPQTGDRFRRKSSASLSGAKRQDG